MNKLSRQAWMVQKHEDNKKPILQLVDGNSLKQELPALTITGRKRR